MVAPLSDVPQESSSVFSLFSLIKLHLASLPLASSYSRVTVSSVFWAQNIFFSAQTRGAPSKAEVWVETVTEGGRRFIAAWRKEEVDAARDRLEKREATRLGTLRLR